MIMCTYIRKNHHIMDIMCIHSMFLKRDYILQKRPMFVGSLLIVTTPYRVMDIS